MSADLAHPHDLQREIPDRLPAATVRALSEIDDGRAMRAIAAEWLGIGAGIGLGVMVPRPAVYAVLAVWIGARQHALAVLMHDAVHYRLLSNRTLNDVVGNVLLGWPVFITVEGFRLFHGEHHRFTNAEGDGNRQIWATHDQNGRMRSEWVYPKRPAGLAGRLLWRASGLTGMWWMVRGILATFLIPASMASRLGKLAFYAAVAALLSWAHAWSQFLWLWMLPFCTWQVLSQYVRLICEHSAVPSPHPEYGVTRTTIPGFLGRLLVIPRHIGYHIEHHWYPSVPFYRLPELHAALMALPGYAANAVVRSSIPASLAECARP